MARAANRWGCKPIEDVCVEHVEPLECRHGCSKVEEHQCKEKEDRDAWHPDEGGMIPGWER